MRTIFLSLSLLLFACGDDPQPGVDFECTIDNPPFEAWDIRFADRLNDSCGEEIAPTPMDTRVVADFEAIFPPECVIERSLFNAEACSRIVGVVCTVPGGVIVQNETVTQTSEDTAQGLLSISINTAVGACQVQFRTEYTGVIPT